ncbi:hypothetical protein BJ165DRAFT_694821 [Panaeolus papilionaceus]|nr:hypothetical protein BJ165DRAFT_694821 [Panaeolus papilionaceus]
MLWLFDLCSMLNQLQALKLGMAFRMKLNSTIALLWRYCHDMLLAAFMNTFDPPVALTRHPFIPLLSITGIIMESGDG